MKNGLALALIAAVICVGCRGSYRKGKWSTGFQDFGEILSDAVWNGDDEYDKSRRFHDQTSDNPRR